MMRTQQHYKDMLKMAGCDIESLFEAPNIIGKDRNYMSPLTSLEENNTLVSGMSSREQNITPKNSDLQQVRSQRSDGTDRSKQIPKTTASVERRKKIFKRYSNLIEPTATKAKVEADSPAVKPVPFGVHGPKHKRSALKKVHLATEIPTGSYEATGNESSMPERTTSHQHSPLSTVEKASPFQTKDITPRPLAENAQVLVSLPIRKFEIFDKSGGNDPE
jgi:hypothetical protein